MLKEWYIMMNNKGQTLVLFIILIPVFIMLAAFIIDTGLIIRESTRLKATTKTVLQDVYYKEYKNEAMIKELLEENDISTNNLKIKITPDKINVKNAYEIESMFGKIIGLKEYNVKIDLTIKEENNKLIITKE